MSPVALERESADNAPAGADPWLDDAGAEEADVELDPAAPPEADEALESELDEPDPQPAASNPAASANAAHRG